MEANRKSGILFVRETTNKVQISVPFQSGGSFLSTNPSFSNNNVASRQTFVVSSPCITPWFPICGKGVILKVPRPTKSNLRDCVDK